MKQLKLTLVFLSLSIALTAQIDDAIEKIRLQLKQYGGVLQLDSSQGNSRKVISIKVTFDSVQTFRPEDDERNKIEKYFDVRIERKGMQEYWLGHLLDFVIKEWAFKRGDSLEMVMLSAKISNYVELKQFYTIASPTQIETVQDLQVNELSKRSANIVYLVKDGVPYPKIKQ
jgi:hypothetical protein